jgi:hypothetical protein
MWELAADNAVAKEYTRQTLYSAHQNDKLCRKMDTAN